MKHVFLRVSPALFVGLLSSQAHALLKYNNSFDLAGIGNAVVKLQGDGVELGTGTIFKTKMVAGGEWLCIITADHVASAAASFKIGTQYTGATYYGNGTMEFLGSNKAWTGLADKIDLAVLGVFIPTADIAALPLYPDISFGAASTANGNQAIMAGYGEQSKFSPPKIVGGTPQFDPDGSFGTYNTGYNSYTGTTAGYSIAGYKHNTLDAQAKFDVAGGVVTTGYSYFFSGDSGGPTFMSNGSGGLNLVGIHSSSQGGNVGPVTPGLIQRDVKVDDYLASIIKPGCDAVPEPATWVAFGLGGVALLRRRRK